MCPGGHHSQTSILAIWENGRQSFSQIASLFRLCFCLLYPFWVFISICVDLLLSSACTNLCIILQWECLLCIRVIHSCQQSMSTKWGSMTSAWLGLAVVQERSETLLCNYGIALCYNCGLFLVGFLQVFVGFQIFQWFLTRVSLWFKSDSGFPTFLTRDRLDMKSL